MVRPALDPNVPQDVRDHSTSNRELEPTEDRSCRNQSRRTDARAAIWYRHSNRRRTEHESS